MKKGILVLGVIITLAGMFFQGKGMERAVETVGELSNREHPKVALTFDDGPHMVYTEMLLDGLKERGICATFFLIGKNIEGNEEIVQRMQKEGHLIGNHTYHHVNLRSFPRKKQNRKFKRRGIRFMKAPASALPLSVRLLGNGGKIWI